MCLRASSLKCFAKMQMHFFNTNDMEIFSRFDLIHYATPEGEMCCPVFVRTKEDAEKWLGEHCKWMQTLYSSGGGLSLV